MKATQPGSPRKRYSYREDPGVPAFPDDRPIVIFDGHCVLCSRFARFLLRQDKQAIFRLMAAQSPTGQALYRHYDLDPVRFETNILLEGGCASFKSTGIIRLFTLLGFPWSLCRILKIVPPALLDRLYECVARNRLRWFGARSVCFVADPVHQERFIA